MSVARLAASVLGVATRRHRSAGVLWRPGVLVGSASALWRVTSVSLTLPGGEQARGELRGVDMSTDLAAVQFDSGALPPAAHAAAMALVYSYKYWMRAGSCTAPAPSVASWAPKPFSVTYTGSL